jgi:hypothetical protein
MPIDISERAHKAGEALADLDMDCGERLAIAKDLVDGVRSDLAEADTYEVAQGELLVAEKAIEMALNRIH